MSKLDFLKVLVTPYPHNVVCRIDNLIYCVNFGTPRSLTQFREFDVNTMGFGLRVADVGENAVVAAVNGERRWRAPSAAQEATVRPLLPEIYRVYWHTASADHFQDLAANTRTTVNILRSELEASITWMKAAGGLAKFRGVKGVKSVEKLPNRNEMRVTLENFTSELVLGGDKTKQERIPVVLRGEFRFGPNAVSASYVYVQTPLGERKGLPHINGGRLCLGGNDTIYGLEMRAGRIEAAIIGVLVSLRELSETGYMRNSKWYKGEVRCRNCGNLDDEDNFVGAVRCGGCAPECICGDLVTEEVGKDVLHPYPEEPGDLFTAHERCTQRCGQCGNLIVVQPCVNCTRVEGLWKPREEVKPEPEPMGLRANLERFLNVPQEPIRVINRAPEPRGIVFEVFDDVVAAQVNVPNVEGEGRGQRQEEPQGAVREGGEDPEHGDQGQRVDRVDPV